MRTLIMLVAGTAALGVQLSNAGAAAPSTPRTDSHYEI
jgi:hypothetical protein